MHSLRDYEQLAHKLNGSLTLNQQDNDWLESNSPDQFLIVYGSLAPGQPNYHELSNLEGKWTPAITEGILVNAGWADNLGYPGIHFHPISERKPIDCQLFRSTELVEHWPRLDEFEGDEYRRCYWPFKTNDGKYGIGFIYALKSKD